MNNILMIVVDCLRYDHYLFLERTLSILPNKVTFHNAWNVAPMSDPNFASILTGTHPDTHGVLTQCMDTMLATLPVILQKAGWETFGSSVGYSGAIKTNNGLASFYTRGFGRWDWLDFHGVFPGDRIWNANLQDMKEPWFTMLRPMDLHGHFRPNGYMKALELLDVELHKLLKRTFDRFPDTVVILMADHGQGLGERGISGHRESLYQFLTHVPVIWSGPNFIRSNHHGFFQHTDISNTLAVMTNNDFGPLDGLDWTPTLIGGGPQEYRDHVIMFSFGSESRTEFNLSELWAYRAIRNSVWVCYCKKRYDEWETELYSVVDDPYEEHEVSKCSPRTTRLLVKDMEWPKLDALQEYDEKVVLERLRAIGYAD